MVLCHLGTHTSQKRLNDNLGALRSFQFCSPGKLARDTDILSSYKFRVGGVALVGRVLASFEPSEALGSIPSTEK